MKDSIKNRCKKMFKSRMKGTYPKMFNPYLYEKLAQTHYQELLQEAEQQRMLIQLPRRHPHLIHTIIKQLATYRLTPPFFAKSVKQSTRTVTGQL
jgi:hypothetical protein